MSVIIQDLEIVPDMKTSKPKLAYIFFSHIGLSIIWDFSIQYFQQKYMHMQIQYKNNYAKYAAFIIELIVGVFFLWKRRWYNTPPAQGRKIYFELEWSGVTEERPVEGHWDD